MGKVKMLAREKARKVMSMKEAYDEDVSMYTYGDGEAENAYEEALMFNYEEDVEVKDAYVEDEVSDLTQTSYVEETEQAECYDACKIEIDEENNECSLAVEASYVEDNAVVVEETNDLVEKLDSDYAENNFVLEETNDLVEESVETSYVEDNTVVVEKTNNLVEDVVEASYVEEAQEEVVEVSAVEETVSDVANTSETLQENTQGCSVDGNCSTCENADCMFSKVASDKEAKAETVKIKELIYEYAYCGGVDFFNKQINQIAMMAEKEEWSNRKDGAKNVLKKYIVKTFERCYKLGIISVSSDGNWSCFNTGLITTGGQDIIGVFSKNTKLDQQEWYLEGFKTESDSVFLDNFKDIPLMATYCNGEDYYFDTDKDIVLSVETVLEENFDKYPKEVKSLGKEVLKLVVMSSFEAAKKKVKRNTRLVVPQYSDDKFGYLMPITIPVSDSKNVTMALVVEKMASGNYIVNNMITVDMAYSRARQVMKPEATWLIKE